jgi:hypothetical protein
MSLNSLFKLDNNGKGRRNLPIFLWRRLQVRDCSIEGELTSASTMSLWLAAAIWLASAFDLSSSLSFAESFDSRPEQRSSTSVVLIKLGGVNLGKRSHRQADRQMFLRLHAYRVCSRYSHTMFVKIESILKDTKYNKIYNRKVFPQTDS